MMDDADYWNSDPSDVCVPQTQLPPPPINNSRTFVNSSRTSHDSGRGRGFRSGDDSNRQNFGSRGGTRNNDADGWRNQRSESGQGGNWRNGDGGGRNDWGGGRQFGGDRGGGRNFDGERGAARNFGGDRDGRNFGGGRNGASSFGGGRDGERNFGGGRDGERNFGGGRGNRRGGRGSYGHQNRQSNEEVTFKTFRNFDDEGDEKVGVEDGEDFKKKASKYIPPPPPEDEDEIYGSGVSSGINFSKYDDIPVKVTGEDPPSPIQSFEEAEISPFLRTVIAKCGYQMPTPIQKYAIPCVAAGRDIMACAQTGSGKTAAFLIPIMQSLLTNEESSVSGEEFVLPQAVVIAPTRELCVQIWEESRKFVRGSNLKTCVLYGGTHVYHQIDQLMEGANIVVATPGRLNDLIKRGNIRFEKLRFVILDEADRMLDMGFKKEFAKIMAHESILPENKLQTLMFSATFPESIQRLASQYMDRYLFITIGQVGGACSDVEQRVLQVDRYDKRDTLLQLFADYTGDRTVVFVETKRQAEYLFRYLSERGLPATAIHGDRDQEQRELAMADFKKGRKGILVATAVASRGLDIKDVRHVINFDLPKEIEDYVHRIGRTGRLGNQGLATSFFAAEKDHHLGPPLVAILAQACQPVPDFLQNAYGNGLSDALFGGCDMRGKSAA